MKSLRRCLTGFAEALYLFESGDVNLKHARAAGKLWVRWWSPLNSHVSVACLLTGILTYIIDRGKLQVKLKVLSHTVISYISFRKD